MPGFARGRKLDKIGLHDTAGLFFDDVRVPAANLPGREGGGFVHLMERLPPERLSIAMMALAPVRAALDWTVDCVTQRTASGRPLAAFQNTRFELATSVTEVHVLRGLPGQSGPGADRGHADRGRRSQGQARPGGPRPGPRPGPGVRGRPPR
jgi:alkylation response protein AidB-like acyl-CoA dehydrogenase